ncbi:MAG: homoserine kinase [Terrisporobacter sp.]|uniref:homoserine kinase n=1 Tax=Terrisporobacter sp. TaxID=1965305 RepID=UPI002FCBE39C
MLEVIVPATSANIGPGYDCLGIALSLYNKFYFEEINEGIDIEEKETEYINDDNLVYKSMLYFFDKVKPKKIPKGIKIKIKDEIPICRGLGSSAACIVAGLMGANYLCEANLDKEEILKLATEIEGHPDNVAPAIYGNMMVSFIDNDEIYYDKIKVPENLRFCAMIPDFKLSTAKSRGVLPKVINHKDGVFNVSRTALLITAFMNNNLSFLKVACQDKFHQDFRSPLIKNYDKIVCHANKLNCLGTFLSGAGPTIMSLTCDDDELFISQMNGYLCTLENNWIIKDLHCDKQGVVVNILN